jgi:hypothetical protein
LFGNQPKPETAAEKPKGGLFGGLTSSQPKTEVTSMETEKPKGSLFGGMVSSQPKTETTPMTAEAEKPKGGLFSGMVSSQPKTEVTQTPKPATGGLFGSQQKAETTPAPTQTQAEKPKEGLFSGMATSQQKNESPQRSIQPSSLGSFGQSHAPATQPKKETASPPSTSLYKISRLLIMP